MLDLFMVGLRKVLEVNLQWLKCFCCARLISFFVQNWPPLVNFWRCNTSCCHSWKSRTESRFLSPVGKTSKVLSRCSGKFVCNTIKIYKLIAMDAKLSVAETKNLDYIFHRIEFLVPNVKSNLIRSCAMQGKQIYRSSECRCHRW